MSQTEVVLSAEPLTKKFVNGWKFKPLTESVWLLNYCLILSEFKSNNLMEESPDDDKMKSPVSWNFSFQTGPVCTSWNVWAIEEFMKSQTLMHLSPPAVIKWLPAGWKSTAQIQSLCPSPVMIFSLFSRFQIFQLQSSPAVATIYFFACNAIPPIPLGSFCVCASIFLSIDILSIRSSNVCVRYGLGRASSGQGVF